MGQESSVTSSQMECVELQSKSRCRSGISRLGGVRQRLRLHSGLRCLTGQRSRQGNKEGSFPLWFHSADPQKHFLFKTSSGTTPLFSSSSPGYPLTSGTVYSPPPRLLSRNTFSRSSFKLKKPSKYCSWKCAAVSAIAAATLLAVLLSYFVGGCAVASGRPPPCASSPYGSPEARSGEKASAVPPSAAFPALMPSALGTVPSARVAAEKSAARDFICSARILFGYS
ncbi:hypothetical protein Z043_119978 [Scleropages formosus]|uniref:Teneurin N-terminal domain-containing protein n=1 Tax=Scleropages formosus TaxID=113540 RepID=A0A0P7WLJ5_SCLFO|nr:hypothetical protein Z043_119978 [Scleropages formosus]